MYPRVSARSSQVVRPIFSGYPTKNLCMKTLKSYCKYISASPPHRTYFHLSSAECPSLFHPTSMAPPHHKRAHSPSPSPDNPPDQTARKRLWHSTMSQWCSIPSCSPSQGNAEDDAEGDAGDNDQELTNTGPMHSTESADEATLGTVFSFTLIITIIIVC